MTLIYRFLTRPGLRKAAADALVSIVSKKMGAADKLNLITFLNVTDVLSTLSQDEDVEFSESLARLVNAQGLELARILSEVFHRDGVNLITGRYLVRSRDERSKGTKRSFSSPIAVCLGRV